MAFTGCRRSLGGPIRRGSRLQEVSFAMCEQLRTLAADRLAARPFGSVSSAVLGAVEDRLRLLLAL
jgi:mRNA-degrading endonuclease toxin of MazEF toxin-antitoxin module